MKKYLLLLLLASFSLEAQIVNIPDANFKAKLLEANDSSEIAFSETLDFIKIDINENGEIEEEEAAQVYGLNVMNSNITSLVGLEFFINLRDLACSYNPITSLDLSSFDFFSNVTCDNTLVENVELTCEIYQYQPFSYGYISFSNNPNLTNLSLTNISSSFEVFIKDNQSLVNLEINVGEIQESLEIRNNVNLTNLSINKINNGDIHNIMISNNDNLDTLDFQSENVNFNVNLLSFLNLSSLEVLNLDKVLFSSGLEIYNLMNLRQLNLKNGNNVGTGLYSLGTLPSLEYICVNDWDVDYFNSVYGSDNRIINSYCSFVPGGEFFTIQGNSKLDLSSNGCDESDIDFPNMKFNITSGTISGSIISNSSGDYSIPVQEGTHTVTPVFENPSYFNVSPSNFSVSFPTETSPFTQNFCITPNGTHLDVEVVVVPLGIAIPGFDTSYKLVYKNKGNTTVSGSISFTFMDSVMDFVSSDPVQSMVEPNILNWNYTNLQPFETREIVLTFNLNSPQETPALNDGEILEFIAIIDPLSGDEMPSDNTSTLNQTVFNSYDPNDKTCLEGSVVSTELIGQYVHYVIRFENTGTFFAQNVVVKDEIDVSKFDLNSLIVLSTSHQQWTRINGNKVEFIFENIQLPFPPSEERHGYIAFKIKLKNNLTVGDTFSNFASIYFDYNFPIITEPATTSIEALSNPDFEFSSFVKLYPNPTNSKITIESQTINLKSIEIFNSLGQLMQAIPNDNNQLSIDVSNLSTGTYFVKVHSDRGVWVSKFVKQ